MEYTIEKLRQGMSLAHLSTWQQAYVEARWNSVKDKCILNLSAEWRKKDETDF